VTRFPVIAGPTAGGKSALAMTLARRRPDIEIVSADSMQIYRGLNVGTAKPTSAERAEVPHHLIDIVDPGEPFSVDDWLRRAEQSIEEIRRRERLPVVVGGTHLYIKALLEGLFEGPPPDRSLRAELAAIPPADLRRELERLDPEAAARIHPNDLRRTIRALEVQRATGRPISEHQRQWDESSRTDALLVVLRWDPDTLNERINQRVRTMVDEGLVEEARALWRQGRLTGQAAQGLGYKQLLQYFESAVSLEKAIERIKIETRRFAKNQRTWLRRLAGPAYAASGHVSTEVGHRPVIALDASAGAETMTDWLIREGHLPPL
jgi:tRNA dimethylallyltransferase